MSLSTLWHRYIPYQDYKGSTNNHSHQTLNYNIDISMDNNEYQEMTMNDLGLAIPNINKEEDK